LCDVSLRRATPTETFIFFSTTFYACSIWYDSLKASTKTKFDALFYRLLRVPTRDFKRMIPRSELVQKCKRATPSEWVKYTTSSKVIKIMRDSKPLVLYDRLRSNFYQKTGDQVWASSMIGPLTERDDRVHRTVSHSSSR